MASENNLNEQAELFKFIQELNYDEVKRILTLGSFDVNCIDNDGMTPLQHAAYKGNFKLCKLLTDCGADVNLSYHSSDYSALMFAALSGNGDVTSLLLKSGALPLKVNSINKTAAQMAAFVGNRQIVRIIDNYIPIAMVEAFNEVGELRTEPLIPAYLCAPVHSLAVTRNVNPVRLALYLEDNRSLLENGEKVAQALVALSKTFYGEKDVLSFKLHHISFIVLQCKNYFNATNKNINKIAGSLIPLIKSWIKRDDSGFPVIIEKLIRQGIREYSYVQSDLFQHFVSTLGATKIGDEPTAISLITETINGAEEVNGCETCGDTQAEKKCSVCKNVTYCNQRCQKLHWSFHKLQCKSSDLFGESKGSENNDSCSN